MESEVLVPLTHTEKMAVQMVAASMRFSGRQVSLGLAADDLRRYLKVSGDQEIAKFLERANRFLAQETVPAKLVYDEDTRRYYYLATITPRRVLERFTPRTLWLYMLMYYLQVVGGHRITTLGHLISEVVSSTDAQSPRLQVKRALEPLLDFGIILQVTDPVNSEEGYRLTSLGRAFMSDNLLQHMTELVMNRHFDSGVVVEFFRRHRKSGTDRPTTNQLNFIME